LKRQFEFHLFQIDNFLRQIEFELIKSIDVFDVVLIYYRQIAFLIFTQNHTILAYVNLFLNQIYLAPDLHKFLLSFLQMLLLFQL